MAFVDSLIDDFIGFQLFGYAQFKPIYFSLLASKALGSLKRFLVRFLAGTSCWCL